MMFVAVCLGALPSREDSELSANFSLPYRRPSADSFMIISDLATLCSGEVYCMYSVC